MSLTRILSSSSLLCHFNIADRHVLPQAKCTGIGVYAVLSMAASCEGAQTQSCSCGSMEDLDNRRCHCYPPSTDTDIQMHTVMRLIRLRLMGIVRCTTEAVLAAHLDCRRSRRSARSPASLLRRVDEDAARSIVMRLQL